MVCEMKKEVKKDNQVLGMSIYYIDAMYKVGKTEGWVDFGSELCEELNILNSLILKLLKSQLFNKQLHT